MQNSKAPRIHRLRRRLLRRGRVRLIAASIAAALVMPVLSAQPSAARAVPPTSASANRNANDDAHSAAPAKIVETGRVPAPPAAAPLPQWPVNDPAQEASVTWTAQGLSIDARNSSLRQILNAVQSQIGVKIQGFDKDQRVFGIYGPGQPRDVLSELLEGTDYNLLMVGNGKNGVPQQILLSEKPAGGTQPNAPVAQGDTYEPPIAPYEPPRPLPPPPGMRPNEAPRTPQQILQEMQQRELIMRQQQLQQQQRQQQQQEQDRQQ